MGTDLTDNNAIDSRQGHRILFVLRPCDPHPDTRTGKRTCL